MKSLFDQFGISEAFHMLLVLAIFENCAERGPNAVIVQCTDTERPESCRPVNGFSNPWRFVEMHRSHDLGGSGDLTSEFCRDRRNSQLDDRNLAVE